MPTSASKPLYRTVVSFFGLPSPLLDARDLDGLNVRLVLAVERPLRGLPDERVLVHRRQDVRRGQFTAVGPYARGRNQPALAVARPQGVAEAAVIVEKPRPQLAGPRVLEDHLQARGVATGPFD